MKHAMFIVGLILCMYNLDTWVNPILGLVVCLIGAILLWRDSR